MLNQVLDTRVKTATYSATIIRIRDYEILNLPRTVVVHATDAATTDTAVVSTRRPISLTLHAHRPAIIL